MSEVVGRCQCGETFTVTEPTGGQSLFGTLGYAFARHADVTGHRKQNIDWNRTEL